MRQPFHFLALLAAACLVAVPASAYEVVALDGRAWHADAIDQLPGALRWAEGDRMREVPSEDLDYRETLKRNLEGSDGVLLAFSSGATLRCASATWEGDRIGVRLESGGKLAFPLASIDFRRSVRLNLAGGALPRQDDKGFLTAAGAEAPKTTARRRGTRQSAPSERPSATSPAEGQTPGDGEGAARAPRAANWVVTATMTERRPLSALSLEVGYPANCSLTKPKRAPGFLRFGRSLPGEVEAGIPGIEPLRVSGQVEGGGPVRGPGRFLRAVFRCEDEGGGDPIFELISATAEAAETGEQLDLEVRLSAASR